MGPPCACAGSTEEEEDDPFEWEVRHSSTPFVHHAVAGSCAGVMEHISMYPVDTVKTHMQASPIRLGVVEATRSVLRSQGAVGLMRGATVIGAGCIPAHAGFFGTYELATARLVGDEDQQHHPLRMAAAGAAATAVHDAILTPHDVAKQRLQLGRYSGPVDCVMSVWRQEGVRGFYRSLPVTLAMNIPYTGMLVACNDSLRRILNVCRGGSPEARLADAPWYFLCAGSSGALAGAATMPLDVVKTRLQTQSGQRLYEGVIGTARRIVREEGVRSLFRGFGPRVLLTAPSAAVSWGTYETVRTALHGFSVGASAGGAGEVHHHRPSCQCLTNG